ncbi:hypothetical protein OAG60_02605, partial [bacterium]|nr:hypothetical protein [bacterium]
MVYLCVWALLLIEVRTLQMLPNWAHLILGLLSLPLAFCWFRNTYLDEGTTQIQRWLTATVLFLVWWQLALVALDTFILDSARANVARWGTAVLFGIGLLWIVWAVERASVYYRRLSSERDPAPDSAKAIWNPLNLDASFY